MGVSFVLPLFWYKSQNLCLLFTICNSNDFASRCLNIGSKEYLNVKFLIIMLLSTSMS